MSQSKFNHEEIYRGSDLIKKLSSYHITVCGAGAVGSNLVDTLSRSAFSNIKVIDKDRVENSNLSTQVWSEKDIGALKADALKNKVFMNVGTEIESINKELNKSNVAKFLKGSNLVVDAFDNSASRKLVQDECRAKKLNCLHIGLGEQGNFAEIIWDFFYKVPQDTTGDVCDYPMARNLICLAVAIAAEEIMDFCVNSKPRLKNWALTLKDLTIKELRLCQSV
jgi:tRNA A37 threonylcarbamoyladenosine dehydratase